MSHRYTNEALGVHEINLLYKHRKRLETIATEQLQLLRAIAADQSDVKPEWFWFRYLDEGALVDTLLMRATEDSDDDVRIGALDLMASARIRIPQTLWPALPWNHKSYSVQQSALDYLVAVGEQNILTFLDNFASDDNSLFSSGVQTAKVQILSRLDPNKALSEVIAKDQYVSDEQLRSLPIQQYDVEEKTLLRGVESQWGGIRQLCAEELARRNSLHIDLANKLTNDESLSVRALGFRALAVSGALPDPGTVRKALSPADKGGGNIAMFSSLLGKSATEPDADSIITTYFKTLPTERLLEAVDWYSLDGHIAYAALAEDRFDTFGETLRSDLVSSFDRVREESIKRQEEEFGPQVRELINDKWKDLESFIRSQFTRAALSGLAKHAQAQDAALARPYLDRTSSWVRDPAVTIVSKVGTSEDVGALLRIAKDTYGEVSVESATGALALSPEPLKIASALISSNKSDLVTLALRWLYTQDSADNNELFEMFLHDGDAKRRAQALYYLHLRLGDVELEKLLERYLESSTYYYDVVAWLDRLLYAPPLLKGIFIRDLEQKTNR